jgi:hypothetical protein
MEQTPERIIMYALALDLKLHHAILESIPDTMQPRIDELKDCTDPTCMTCKLVRQTGKYLETGEIPEELKEA